jgi:hypothetical protein
MRSALPFRVQVIPGLRDIGGIGMEGMCGSPECGGDRHMRERIGTTLTTITMTRAGECMRVTGTMTIMVTITMMTITMGITGS